MNRNKHLTLLLFAFFCNTLLWATITEIGHPPDELSHFDYVLQLAVNHTLPVYGKTTYIFNPDHLQAHALQPPLYYMACAPVQMLLRQQPIEIQMLGVRMVSILMATGTVALAYISGRLLVPSRPAFALAMGVLVGFNPQFTHISSAINSDNLINLIVAAIFCMLVYRGRHPQPVSRRWLIGLGVLLGVGMIAKQTIVTGLFVSGIVLLWLAWQHRGQRLLTLVRFTLLVGGPALLVSGWSLVRNWMLYGDPFGLSPVGSQAQSYIPKPYAAIGSFWEMLFATRSFDPFLDVLFKSFWGYFDHLEWLMPQEIYTILACLAAGGLIGSLIWLVRNRHTTEKLPAYRMVFIAGLLIAITFALLLNLCYRIDYQAQGRYVYSALLPIMLMIVAGWEQIAGVLRKRWLATALLIPLMLAINLAALVTTLAPAHHYRYINKAIGNPDILGALTSAIQSQQGQTMQVVYGPFEAHYQFVAEDEQIAHLDMLLDMSPGIYGPVIWRVSQHQEELFHAIAPQLPRKLAHYTIQPPDHVRFHPGETYLLTIQAPWANREKPLRVYLPPSNGSAQQPIDLSPTDIPGWSVTYTNDPLQDTLLDINEHLTSASIFTPRGKVQLLLYGVVIAFFLLLSHSSCKAAFFAKDLPDRDEQGARTLRHSWPGWVGTLLFLTITIVVLQFPTGKTILIPEEQFGGASGELRTLPRADKQVFADLLLLAESPSVQKYPPDDLATGVSHIQPVLFPFAHGEDPTLAMHPVSSITYTLELPADAQLHTAVALNPLVWQPAADGSASDGVEFVVRLTESDGSAEELFRHMLNPVHREQDRGWYEVSLNLDEYAGEQVRLSLSTLPGPANDVRFDWAGWRSPTITVNPH